MRSLGESVCQFIGWICSSGRERRSFVDYELVYDEVIGEDTTEGWRE